MSPLFNKLNAILKLARPHQYLKNAFVWLPLFFGYRLMDSQAVLHTFYAFVSFCLAASCVYALNDINDISEDSAHPIKKNRPLANGSLGKTDALIVILVFLPISFLIPLFLLPINFVWVLGGYVIINIFYSCFLKHIAVIDIICIATGFLLRVFAGGVASDIFISPWIVIMTFLLALFLALAKRRDDLLLADTGQQSRKSLDGYSMEFVSLSMGVMASVIIVSYILYTVSPEIVAKHGTNKLYLTGLWVIIGMLRYMQITFVEGRSGSPTMVLVKDYFLQAVIISWIMNLYYLLYWKK